MKKFILFNLFLFLCSNYAFAEFNVKSNHTPKTTSCPPITVGCFTNDKWLHVGSFSVAQINTAIFLTRCQPIIPYDQYAQVCESRFYYHCAKQGCSPAIIASP